MRIAVDAGAVSGMLAPLWHDHYDLSFEHLNYAGDAGLPALIAALAPRSWRCSVGRWEVGLTPPAGGDSMNPAVLQTVEREFYRGPNTLMGADDPANYEFTYLDAQLAGIIATGAEPYVSFDYMPFTLSSEQDPANAFNLGSADPSLSFSNGIRTAPPADSAVYARVVLNTVKHLRGLFAGTTDFGITYIEIGNEPDLADGNGNPAPYFWTGTAAQWISMYAAIAAEIDGDGAASSLVKLGGGSFGLSGTEQSPTFMEQFLTSVVTNGTRLDFLSYHSYNDDPVGHFLTTAFVSGQLAARSLTPELINAEWGRALNGPDPVYDRIGHGLFRAKAMAVFEFFGVQAAHEALLRDPVPGANLGLLSTSPAASKPVSDVYQALAKLDATPQALTIDASDGAFVMAGKDAGGTKVVIVFPADSPGFLGTTRITLAVNNLPWGAATFDLRRYLVSDQTWRDGSGVTLVETQAGLSGPALETTLNITGGGQLIVWELEKNP